MLVIFSIHGLVYEVTVWINIKTVHSVVVELVYGDEALLSCLCRHFVIKPGGAEGLQYIIVELLSHDVALYSG